MKNIPATLASLLSGGLLAGLGLLAYGHRELNQFQLHDYEIPLLPPGTVRGGEFRIMHLSDLHMIPGQEEKIQFVRWLDELDPHLVVNTGDNLSDTGAVPHVIRALEPLLARPGLFVFGTNDYWAPRPVNPLKYLVGSKREPSQIDLPWDDMRAVFLERGWRDANQARHEFKVGPVKLAVAGVDDPHHDLDDYSEIAGPPHPDADLALALLHAPEPRVLRQFALDGYQLALAGHTHGGQICLPGGHAIITNSDIDRRRAQGLHDFEGMALHVSNGLGTSKYAPVRLFCRPSATLLRIVERPA